jgi:hypothetical protein
MAADPSVNGLSVPAALVEAVIAMRTHNPKLLDTFRVAMREAADAAAHATVSAAPDHTPVAQGRARAFQALAALFANPEAYFIQTVGRK